LDQLANFEAIVHDGATGQFYSMRTRPPLPGTEGHGLTPASESMTPSPPSPPREKSDKSTGDNDSLESESIELEPLKLEEECPLEESAAQNQDNLRQTNVGIQEIEPHLGTQSDFPQDAGSFPTSFATKDRIEIFHYLPNFTHASLSSPESVTFLKTSAEQAWKSGTHTFAYRLQHAAFNNELRMVSPLVPTIPEGNVFEAAKYLQNFLAERGVTCAANVMKAFYDVQNEHSRLITTCDVRINELGRVLGAMQGAVLELLQKIASLSLKRPGNRDFWVEGKGEMNASL
jgi:hypothetical protein